MPVEVKNFNEELYTHEFISNLYDEGFMSRNWEHKRQQNLNLARIMYEHFEPKSVVDFGCGIGSYLEVFKSNGCDVRGFEYGYDAAKPQYDKVGLREEITFGDVTKQISVDKKYDLAICIEVAEHIPTSKSDVLIDNIVNSVSDDGNIFFTAALPGQGGTGHINCQPKSFWIDKFLQRGWGLAEEHKYIDNDMVPVRQPSEDPNSVWEWVYNNFTIYKRTK